MTTSRWGLRGLSLSGALLIGMVAQPATAESFWAPVLKREAAPVPAQTFDKRKPDIAGLRLGMPAIAAKRELTLAQEPPLLVTELFYESVPGSYGLMAYDTSALCRHRDVCTVRMRVLFSRAAVWFVAREYLDGPYAKESEAGLAMAELLQEISLQYGLLATRPGQGPGEHPEVDRFFDRSGKELPSSSVCERAAAQRVVGIEPLEFSRDCGWSYRHAIELVKIGEKHYVKGILQLADLDQPYPEMTEPLARKSGDRGR